MSDLTQSSACELCKIALATGALFLDHRELLRPIPDCIPYCRSTVFGPKLHLVTHPLELCAISHLCVQIGQSAKKAKEKRARPAARVGGVFGPKLHLVTVLRHRVQPEA